MPPGETGLRSRNPWVTRRPLTVAEYHRMGNVGILNEDDRVELIDGQRVAMTPIGSNHSGAVNSLTRQLVLAVGGRGVFAVQNPVQLGDRSEPQPDFAVLKPRADDYRNATPRADDCRRPSGDDYALITRAGRDAVLDPELIPGVAIPAAAILG